MQGAPLNQNPRPMDAPAPLFDPQICAALLGVLNGPARLLDPQIRAPPVHGLNLPALLDVPAPLFPSDVLAAPFRMQGAPMGPFRPAVPFPPAEVVLAPQEHVAFMPGAARPSLLPASMVIQEGQVRSGQVLGSGSFGIVTEAYVNGQQGVFALKVLITRKKADPFHRRSMMMECDILATLQHPNVLKLAYAVVSTEYGGDVVGHVTKKAIYGSLTTYMATNPPLSLRMIIHLAMGLVDAAINTHAHGYLHFDIKSDNVMVDHDFHSGMPFAVLADYGLALPGYVEGRPFELQQMRGTECYAAAEMFKPDAEGVITVGAAADVWSIGCVLNDLAAGAPITFEQPKDSVGVCVPYQRLHAAGWTPEVCSTYVHLACIVRRCFLHEPRSRPTLPQVRAMLEVALAFA
jgi:hypothetical protein